MYLYACVAVTHKKYWISLINHAYSNFNNTKRNPRQNSIVTTTKTTGVIVWVNSVSGAHSTPLTLSTFPVTSSPETGSGYKVDHQH